MQTQGAPGPSDLRNLLIAVVLSIAIMLGFEFFYWQPQRAKSVAEQALIEAQTEQPAAAAEPDRGLIDRASSLAASAGQRVSIETPAVDGSIQLVGARLDDLNLRHYRQTVEPDSAEVTLLSPRGAEQGFDAFFGWEDRNVAFLGVGADQVWRAEDGARLTPETPVTLTFTSDDGLEVRRTIEIDDNYMFTITDRVRNLTQAPREMRPFGVVRRQGMPAPHRGSTNVHQGFAGAFGPNQHLHTISYKRAEKHAADRARGRVGEDERIVQEQGEGGWLGVTDHYWLTAIAPDQSETISAYYDARTTDDFIDFRAAYRGEWRNIGPGGTVVYTQHLFAGAKSVELLQAYQRDLGIPKFDDAVDWGNLMWPLTRPFFNWLLHPLSKFAGSFALGLLLTTVVIKAAVFPLVYHSYKEMAKMRAVQPKMKEIQERYAADKPRMQQEMIKLYQTEKVNPVSGCLPILLTMPVFFALYKVLSVTIEMRHTPFVGWIQDMSAPDPTTIFNLFGLLPFEPQTLPIIGSFLAIGFWPLLYGVTQWAVQALSPPPPDPTQAMIFRFMPIVLTFLFASFPAGMVIYWVWSNTLTFLQQYVIMRRQGVETQLDLLIAKYTRKGAATPAE